MRKAKTIATAAEHIVRAEEAMQKLLEKAYPMGTDVRCTLQHGQVNPSHGQVIGHPGGRFAYLRIRLRSRTSEVRDVPVERVW